MKPVIKRLTRQEKQAHTRACLLISAARVFAQRGLQQATIDEVAEGAGFSKGAFYANFASKEELFLAMLDERFAAKTDELERIIAGEGTDEEKAIQAGNSFTQQLLSDPEWQRLFLEFSAYAGRNDEFRDELRTRYRWMRGRVAAALELQATSLGLTSPFPPEQIAEMTCAMAHGVAVERLIEGDDLPEDLFGNMLLIFFAGLRTLAGQYSSA